MCLKWTKPTTPRAVPPALLPHNSQHSLEWLRHQYWSPWKGKINSIGTILLKSQIRGAGHKSSLSRIILCDALSTDHRDRRAPNKQFKNCLKKSFDHCRWSTLAEDSDAKHLPTNYIISTFVNICRTIGAGEGTSRQRHLVLTRPSAAAVATVPACFVSALSATNVPVASINRLLFDFRFTKPRHEDICLLNMQNALVKVTWREEIH